jgi:hypothetical protein
LSIRVLRGVVGADGGEEARRFIEQLWEYDQIVFELAAFEES